MLERRYGPGVGEHRRAMFEQAGLPYAGTLEKIPNSRQALILSELARERGLYEVLHPRLFDAFWGRGLDIGDQDVLIEEGSRAGLGEDEIVNALRDPRYLELVAAQTSTAIELGAGGVPAWLIDQRLLVPGAQPHEVFERVLNRLGYRPIA